MERSIAFIALFAALTVALGLVPAITLPMGVPISAQSLGIMLCGTILGSKRGALAALLFVLLVIMGLPVLSGGRGGLAVFTGPTVGFVIGFPVAAFVTGLIVELWKNASIGVVATVAALLGGILVLYLFGVTGMSIVLGKSFVEAAKLVIAFIPGDLIKALLAGVITAALYKARPASVLSRPSDSADL